jgi:hypothetical protein
VAERAAWQALRPDIDIDRLVFIDETGASTKMASLYGRSPSMHTARGKRRRSSALNSGNGARRPHGWPGISHRGIELPTPRAFVDLRGVPASPAGPKAPAVEIDSRPLVSPAAGISGTRDATRLCDRCAWQRKWQAPAR